MTTVVHSEGDLARVHGHVRSWHLRGTQVLLAQQTVHRPGADTGEKLPARIAPLVIGATT